MLGWLRKVSRRRSPESRWVVSVDDERITVTNRTGQSRSIAKQDLTGIAIETNDSGPWGSDVWWLFFGSDQQLACSFPQGATGEQAAMDYAYALPAFDFGEVTNAMSATGNGYFPVWKKRA